MWIGTSNANEYFFTRIKSPSTIVEVVSSLDQPMSRILRNSPRSTFVRIVPTVSVLACRFDPVPFAGDPASHERGHGNKHDGFRAPRVSSSYHPTYFILRLCICGNAADLTYSDLLSSASSSVASNRLRFRHYLIERSNVSKEPILLYR